jgi:hypothetical protein
MNFRVYSESALSEIGHMGTVTTHCLPVTVLYLTRCLTPDAGRPFQPQNKTEMSDWDTNQCVPFPVFMSTSSPPARTLVLGT